LAGAEAIPSRQPYKLGSVLEPSVETVLAAVVAVLETRPELADRLRLLLATGTQKTQATKPFMSVVQYAAHRCVSERSIRYDVEKMTRGVEYQRSGRRGGRVVINVAAADAWYAERGRKIDPTSSIEQLAVDEVTRRRARVALKRKEK